MLIRLKIVPSESMKMEDEGLKEDIIEPWNKIRKSEEISERPFETFVKIRIG